jgi:hypothetical protein
MALAGGCGTPLARAAWRTVIIGKHIRGLHFDFDNPKKFVG